MMKAKKYSPTGTSEKILADNKIHSNISIICNDLKETSVWLGLVGHASELKRHIRQAKDKGFLEENIVFVENNKKTYQELIIEAEKLGFKGILVYDDFLNCYNRIDRTMVKVGLDFDACSTICDYHIELFNEFSKRNDLWLNITADPRCKTVLDYLAEKLKLEKVWRLAYWNKFNELTNKIQKQKMQWKYPSANKIFIAFVEKLGKYNVFDYVYDSQPIITENKSMKYKKMLSILITQL